MQAALAALLVATLLPVNLLTRAWPMHQPEKNLLYEQTLSLSKITPLQLAVHYAGWDAVDIHSLFHGPHGMERTCV